LMNFDNGFPATVARDYIADGQLQRGWVQEKCGEPFEVRIRALAKERHGSDSNDAVVALIMNDPRLKQSVEEASVERLIYGDLDHNLRNLVMEDTPNGLKVRNVHLVSAFPRTRAPIWWANDPLKLSHHLHVAFGDAPLSATTVSKIHDFVLKYDSAAGRGQLANLGLWSSEIEGVLSRARWLGEHGRFPSPRGLSGGDMPL